MTAPADAKAAPDDAQGAATAPSTRTAPPPEPRVLVIEPSRGLVPVNLRELWEYRELLFFLAWRDVKVRYAQSILGAAWAVIQPLMTMVVFNVLFGLLMGKDGKPTAEGIPYAVSTYCALVPWQLFARAFTASGDSLVRDQGLITKVYFPRLVAPIAPLLAALLDFAVAFVVLIGMMLWYGLTPGWPILLLPVLVLFAVVTALAVSLWLSALNAIYRDVRHLMPFLSQLWMYVTPVVYTTASIMGNQPEWVRFVYGLNPMAGVVEGFRWALLGAPAPSPLLMAASGGATLVVLIGGLYFFRRMERLFADLV